MSRVVVMSVGGSIILDENSMFLLELKKVLEKKYGKNRFVIVCGGGSVARQYISILKKEGKSEKQLSLAGIRATRMNAQFLMQVIGEKANNELPKDMKHVKRLLQKNNVVICGALRYVPKETSDGTAAMLAAYFKAPFINITNVNGLYTADPKKNKSAKLIIYQSWDEFEKKALSMRFKPGQHFVLDQAAARLIKKHHTHTFIIGKDAKNLDNLLSKKQFTGTTIGP